MVVVGGGTAGLVSAAGGAGLGAKVALVERHLLGGDCQNTGCVPSKALLRAARLAAEARGAEHAGVRVADVVVDFPAVMSRMRGLRARIAPNDGAARLAGLGVDVFLGEARFVGPRTVEVDGRRLEFARAVIATGARPSAPDIPGLADAGYLTSETIFALTELPARLVVIGAGPIGCEMAQAFARFGSRVTLLRDGGRLLPGADPDAAAIVERHLVRDGVAVDTLTVPFSEVDRAVLDDDGFLCVHVRRGNDRIVAATLVGRHAGETISELTLAMAAGVGLGRLASVIHPYPTEAEATRKAADAWNRTRLTPRVKRLIAAWLRLRR